MRKINWNPREQIIEPEAPAQVHIPAVPTPPPVTTIIQTPTQTTLVQVRTRNGNGHTSTMVRKITESERTWLKERFLRKNGQIEDDDCVTFKSQMVSETIAIFQITGYISVLHRYVALGRLELRDLTAYVSWMERKYRDKAGHSIWTQYNNARFVVIRTTNQQARRLGRPAEATIPIEEVPIQTMEGPVIYATPVFKTMPRRAAYFKA